MIARTAVLFLLASTAVAAAQGGCIAGAVVDDSGSPLAQMHVTVSATGQVFSRVTDTDANGRFRFTDLPLDSYRIFSRNEDLGYPFSNMPEFSGTSDETQLAVTSLTECAQLTMQREPRAAKLRIKLVDGTTGKAIQQPIASFRRTDGRYSWNGITLYHDDLLVPPSKPLEVQMGAIGYEKSEIMAMGPLQPGESRVLAVTLQPVGEGCLSGKVLAADGTAVPEIKVQPLLMHDPLNAKEPLVTLADKRGMFQLRNLHPGTYEVFVDGQDKGYAAFSTAKADGQAPEVTVLSSKTCAELTLTLAPPGGRLHVDIVDANTQQPIKNFRFAVKSAVSKAWWSAESITPELVIPPDKSYSLEVRAQGYQSSSPEFLGTLQPGEVRRVRVSLQPTSASATTSAEDTP